MPAFSVLIDAHMHMKATAGGTATAAAASAAATNKGQGKKKNNNNNSSRPPLSDTEKKRRSVMKGKCYRCGSPDHMANSCNVAKDVKCKKCNVTGHTAGACVSPGSARPADHWENTSSSTNSTIPL